MYLAFLIIGYLAGLAFGDLWNWYTPVFLTKTNLEDFFIAGIIILIAGNEVQGGKLGRIRNGKIRDIYLYF